MFGFFDPVTELVNNKLPHLQLKVFFSKPDKGGQGVYLRVCQVDINERREVSSVKYFNLASDLLSPIQLHVFTDGRFSGVVLNPLDIRNYARLVFTKDPTTDKVQVKGIAKRDLPKSYMLDRRVLGKLFGRDARYNKLNMEFITGAGSSDDQVPSMGLEQQSQKQITTREVSSSLVIQIRLEMLY